MIKNVERVILLRDLKDTPFKKGDVGTVVMIHPEAKGYEIEFFAVDGCTLGVETVSDDEIKSVNGIKKVIHVDEITV
jgi:Domain of unknown function (DUF4926)